MGKHRSGANKSGLFILSDGRFLSDTKIMVGGWEINRGENEGVEVQKNVSLLSECGTPTR